MYCSSRNHGLSGFLLRLITVIVSDNLMLYIVNKQISFNHMQCFQAAHEHNIYHGHNANQPATHTAILLKHVRILNHFPYFSDN